MNLSNLIGWFALLLGFACAVGLAVALSAALSIGSSSGTGGGTGNGLVFLVATSFLGPLGVAAIAAGAIGVFWSDEEDATWHRRRCWFAMLLGVAAAVLGGVYGVALN